jgi:alkanesulfonate monooxygenase SsuD/methylene tetrahydromethanopterin reductase-like flavin-dependent oxidoreductase (luciferase family)
MFPGEVGRIQSALLRNDTDGMISAVSDEMVDAFALAGPPDDVRKRLAAYGELADSICLSPPDQLIDPRETETYREALLATFGGQPA